MPLFELSILNKQFHTRGTPPKIGNRIASVNMHTNYTGSHHRIAAHEEDGLPCRRPPDNTVEQPCRGRRSVGLHNATAIERKQGGKREPTNRDESTRERGRQSGGKRGGMRISFASFPLASLSIPGRCPFHLVLTLHRPIHTDVPTPFDLAALSVSPCAVTVTTPDECESIASYHSSPLRRLFAAAPLRSLTDWASPVLSLVQTHAHEPKASPLCFF
jgi:hypothetical protein